MKNASDVQVLSRGRKGQPASQVYQVSTMTSLLDGVYDGDFEMRDIPKYGDFGIGTFNQLDGELIGFDGEFYRLRSDGKATPVQDGDRSPFCSFTFFKPDITHKIDAKMTREEFEEEIISLLPSKNLFYAIRLDGVFKKVKTRTVELQEKPYVPMVEAVKTQPVFNFDNIRGTIAGFWTPGYANGIAVSGYHLHFIDEGRNTGGHVFDYVIEECTVTISQKMNMNLRLPNTSDFFNANLDNPDFAKDIETTEGNPE
ncbi:acetolactate decarboxylase [Bacillus sp. HU-1818]|uniref:acetolactate decarboxylase n=1 Tax=Bacillus sp. HU-1818 TaxID=2704469 RepID=UPI001BEA2543|nr:acetolactate decarboxylase [Bacillus sp. HU-1818]MBT2625170.1 acetolactate decarboxylase [Bacillus sp. ISL-32]MCI3195589.1 acetolactate decarboxylase [Bacillus sp. HU-1818]